MIAKAEIYVDCTARHNFAVDAERRVISIRPDLSDAELIQAVTTAAAAVLFGPETVGLIRRLRVIDGGKAAIPRPRQEST